MLIKNLIKHYEKQIKAIDLCLENSLKIPTITLIYTTIDALAYLENSNFQEWLEKYVLKNSNISTTSEELYQSRNALLHRATYQSRKMTKDKSIRVLIFSHGEVPEDLNERLKRCSLEKKYYCLHIDTFYCEVLKGLSLFMKEITKDEVLKSIVASRLPQYYESKTVDHYTSAED